MLGLRRGTLLFDGLGPEAVLAHQPSNAMFADAVPLFEQGLPDVGTAIGLTGLDGSLESPRAGTSTH